MDSKKRTRLTIFFISLVQMLHGDVIELANGERLDGQLVSVSRTSVVFEVAGSPIAVERQRVKALHLGVKTGSLVVAQSHDDSFEQAIDEVRALNAFVKTSVSFNDYSAQVTETKMKVERLLSKTRSEGGSARVETLRDSMAAHDYARATWSSFIVASPGLSSVAEQVEQNKRIIGCASNLLQAKPVTGAKGQRLTAEGILTLPLRIGVFMRAPASSTDPALALLWHCSSELLTQATQAQGLHVETDSVQPSQPKQLDKATSVSVAQPTQGQVPSPKGLQGGTPPTGSKPYTIHGQ